MILSLYALVIAFPILSRERDAQPEFEVLVLGTGHAPTMFLSPEYTPAHLRAALERAQPGVVAVECHPTWFAHGRYHEVTYEGEGVAVPWAREHGVPAHGVDWKDIQAWDRDEELAALGEAEFLRGLVEAGGPWPLSAFGLAPGADYEGGPMGEYDLRHINSKEYGLSRHEGLDPEDPDFAGARDRGIARNCAEVMRAHPGERLVVVIGAHHKPFLDVLFGRMEGVRVLQMETDLSWPEDEEVAQAWTAESLLVTATWLLDGQATYQRRLPSDVRERVDRLVGRLEADGSRPLAARYLRARWHALSDRREDAARILDELLDDLAEGADRELYLFPIRWWRMRYSLREAAQLERGLLLLDEGGPAVERGRALLAAVGAAADFRFRQLERTRPRELRTISVVRDADFELGGKADDFFSGWFSYLPTGHGRMLFEGDEAIHVEGARALRVTVGEANPLGYGFHVRQECYPPPDEAGSMVDFELALRGAGLTRAALHALPPYSSSDRTPLASAIVDLAGAGADGWSRARLGFEVPAGGRFALVVEFDGPAGSRLWLDDGTQVMADYVTIPREWSHAATAAAFPVALAAAR